MRTLLLAAACAAVSTQAFASVVYEVDIVNTATSNIVSFEVARAGSDHFHKATFVRTPVQADGESATVQIRGGDDGCLRDLRIGFADGSTLTRRGLDLCRDPREEADRRP